MTPARLPRLAAHCRPACSSIRTPSAVLDNSNRRASVSPGSPPALPEPIEPPRRAIREWIPTDDGEPGFDLFDQDRLAPGAGFN